MLVLADLRGADLAGADLSYTHREVVVWRGSDPKAANLSGADLRDARLEGVAVEEANFQGADLRGVPWLLIMELMLQPETNFSRILWDHSTDE